MQVAIIDNMDAAKDFCEKKISCLCICKDEDSRIFLEKRGVESRSLRTNFKPDELQRFSNESYDFIENVLSGMPEIQDVSLGKLFSSQFAVVAHYRLQAELIASSIQKNVPDLWHVWSDESKKILVETGMARAEEIEQHGNRTFSKATFFQKVKKVVSQENLLKNFLSFSIIYGMSLKNLLLPSPKGRRKKILIAVDGPNMDDILHPLFLLLKERYAVDVLVYRKVSPYNASKLLKFLDRKRRLSIAAAFRFLKTKSRPPEFNPDEFIDAQKEAFSLARYDTFSGIGPRLKFFLKQNFFMACQTVVKLKDFLQKNRYDLVIIGEHASLYGKSILALASRMDARSICVQHGIIANPCSYRKIEADLFFSWGKRTKEYLNDIGIPNERIRVVGCPKALLKKRKRLVRPQKLRSFVEGKKWVVTWAPNPDNPYSVSLGHRIEEVQAFKHVAISHPEIAFIVRLHTREEQYFQYLEFFQGVGNLVLTTSIPLSELLPITSLLIAFNTTAVADGVMSGVPVLALDFYGQHETVPSVSAGVAIPCNQKEELETVMMEMLEEKRKSSRESIERYLKWELLPEGEESFDDAFLTEIEKLLPRDPA